MLNPVLPSRDDLAELIEEATTNKTEQEFVTGHLTGLAKLLGKDPKQYRAYGYFWWAIKELLIENGYNQFGDTLEAGTVDVFNFDDKTLLCVAAWSYKHDMIELGKIYNSDHIFDTVDSDPLAYYLTDMDMETLILS